MLANIGKILPFIKQYLAYVIINTVKYEYFGDKQKKVFS